MSDIKKYKVALTGRLLLKGADGETMYAEGADGEPDKKKPMAVNLYSPGSKQYANANNKRQNHQVDLLKNKGPTKESTDAARRESAEYLAACTESFENVDYDGLTGRDLAIAVYSDIEIGFVADQVAAYLRDWGNFLKPSTTISASTSGKAPG